MRSLGLDIELDNSKAEQPPLAADAAE